ncbi:MAG: DUF4431 domain-containing protein [Bacteroidia bacterium]|nr:DUF4431 domain-containing protein [Bacteroidia bacterium]
MKINPFKNYLFFLIFLICNCSSHQTKSSGNTLPNSFCGTISQQAFWGPPGYGEDTTADKKELVTILTLDTALLIFADTVKGIKQQWVKNLQVISSANLNKYFHKKVSITGTVSEAQTGHHYTDFLINVKEVRAAN